MAAAIVIVRFGPSWTSAHLSSRRPAKPARLRMGACRRVTRAAVHGRGQTPYSRALDGGTNQLADAVGPDPLLILAVLENGPQRHVDGPLVERRAPERGQSHGPVDRLGHARRLVQLEAPHPLDRGRDL